MEMDYIKSKPLTQGNLNQGHFYLEKELTFFPKDSIGGANNESAGKSLEFYFESLDETLHTDIDGEKGILRNGRRDKLSMRFIQHHNLTLGDKIYIIKESQNRYLISISAPAQGSKIVSTTNEDHDAIPSSDLKYVDERTLQSIKTRRGQPEFRKALLSAFQGRCVISQTNVQSVLEAAHIIPHSKESNYSVHNGLLLRADLHTLYDLNQLGVDGFGYVHICPELKNSNYAKYDGLKILQNISQEMSDNLTKRFGQFYAQLSPTEPTVLNLPIDRQQELANLCGESYDEWVDGVKRRHSENRAFVAQIESTPNNLSSEQIERFQTKMDSGNPPSN